MSKLNYKEVIEYFDEISEDMAELVLGMIEDNLQRKKEKKARISANLKKARAARGNKQEAAPEAQQAQQAPVPARQRRREPPSEQVLTAGQ